MEKKWWKEAVFKPLSTKISLILCFLYIDDHFPY